MCVCVCVCVCQISLRTSMQNAQLETSAHIPISSTLEEEGLLYIKLAGNLAPVHNAMSYMHYAYIIRCAFVRKWNFSLFSQQE